MLKDKKNIKEYSSILEKKSRSEILELFKKNSNTK